MNGIVDWSSAIVILVAGLILGSLVVMFFKRAKPAQGDDLQRKDLEAKRDALLQQLRDDDLGPNERTRLELETAQVLRALDQIEVKSAAPATPAPLTMNPSIKGFLWGAGSVAALAGLFYFVMQQSKPREEGQPVTGAMQQQQQPQADPMVMQLEAAVQRDPENLQLRNDLAQAYLEKENLNGVVEQTTFVLQKSPNDSRALTFQGLVRMANGETEIATQMLQRATKADPKNLDSWVALAWIYAQSNRMKDAEATMAEAMQRSPQDRQRLEQVFEQMKQHVARATQQLPEGHPPINETSTGGSTGGSTAGSTAGSTGGVRVTLNLDPSAKTRSGIVFIIARNPAGGPPVAVKRIVATSFPTTVELTSADSMMGQQLPASFRLEARLDTDGDPMTHPATDPSAMQEGVGPGAVVTLALK